MRLARATEDENRTSGTLYPKVTIEYESRVYRLLPTSPQWYTRGYSGVELTRFGKEYEELLPVRVRRPTVDIDVLAYDELVQ